MPEGSREGRTIEAPSIRVGTRQDSIIDLQHEERTGEHQNVADTAEDRHRPENLATGADEVREF